MLHHLTNFAVRGGVAALVGATLTACVGQTLSDPALPPPPPPPARPAFAWSPRTAPPTPSRPVPIPLARAARLNAAAPPPPAPVFRAPVLEPVPNVAVPKSFCSIDEQYAFLDQRQLPAYDAAMRNSAAANAYKAELADLYVQYRDASAGGVHSGAVMAELKRAALVAAASYDRAVTERRRFDAVLAAPVQGRCSRA